MSQPRNYTINEAAALTGRHPNTIRQRIKLGQLEATVTLGKFGEEYRIEHDSLIRVGLLSPDGPLGGHSANGPVLDPELIEDSGTEPAEDRAVEGGPPAALAALGELYQRHEQAMFRLGYLQGEMERLKALAETAESLRQDNDARSQEIQVLKIALEEKQREAREATQQAEAAARQAEEAERLARQAEREAIEADRLRQDLQRDGEEKERLRLELERTRERLHEMETLRQDIESLKAQAAEASRPPRWQFWRR